jgi:hypothetical protein
MESNPLGILEGKKRPVLEEEHDSDGRVADFTAQARTLSDGISGMVNTIVQTAISFAMRSNNAVCELVFI